MIYIKRIKFPNIRISTNRKKLNLKNDKRLKFEFELKLDDYWEDGEKTIEASRKSDVRRKFYCLIKVSYNMFE